MSIILGKKIIVLCGQKGAGKDTCAKLIKDTFGSYYITSFAKTVKQDLSEMYDIPLEMFEDRTFKETVLPVFGKTPRELCIQYAESTKRIKGNDIWAERCIRDIQCNSDINNVIIADCRFPNELMKIKYIFGEENVHVFWIDNPSLNPANLNDRTESSMDKSHSDLVITNNGSKALLGTKLYYAIKYYIESY